MPAAFVSVAVPPFVLAFNAFAAAIAAAAAVELAILAWSAFGESASASAGGGEAAVALGVAVALLGCLDDALSAGELPTLLEGGAELAVALRSALAPRVLAGGVLAAVSCWPDCGGTLDALLGVADHAAGGGGATSASSRVAKGCVSLCWLALAACKRCDADMSEEVTSDVILGALDTAALPEGNMRLMSACNRRASSAHHWKSHKFNMLAAYRGKPERPERRSRGRFCRLSADSAGACCRFRGAQQ